MTLGERCLRLLLSLLVGLVQCSMAYALGLDTPLSLLNHRSFTPMDGAPSSVTSLAQTMDGTLWIGGSNGLSRFDGVRFVGYPAPADDPLPSTAVASLTATADGGLWIGYVFGGASFLRAGHAVHYGDPEGFPPGTTFQVTSDRTGVVWAATSTALARLNGPRWERDADSARFRSTVRGFLIDRRGNQWVTSSDALLVRPLGETRFREVAQGTFDLGASTAIAEAPNGDIWVSTNRELIRVDHLRVFQGGDVIGSRVPVGRTIRPIAFDRLGNLWAVHGGPVRVHSAELAQLARWNVERLSVSGGLSHDAISAFLEDREGNIWVGTANGLDRLSSSSVLRYPVNCPPAVFAPGEAGAIWIRCQNDREITVSRSGEVLSRHDTPPLTAAYRDSDGILWFGGPNSIVHFENGRFVQVRTPPQAGDLPVQAIIRDGNGAVWASFFRGTFRFQDGVWAQNGNFEGLPRGGALALAVAADGAVWFGYRYGRVARLKDRRVQLFSAKDGLDSGDVLTIYPQSDGGVWVGGASGLAWFDGARFVPIENSSDPPLKGISGIMRSANGDLWLNGIGGISHFAGRSVDEAIRDPQHRARAETFNHLDGVPGAAPQLRPVPSAIQATDGRIWFATSAGIVSIDDSQSFRNPLPPPVTVWALTSGAQRYRNIGENIVLPVHTNRLEIEYSAGSLTVPERVKFRYRLDGIDRDWQDAESRREAVYGNLGPGDYSFRVIASNNDGVWNETGATLTFTIAPAYYQTRWFHALCGLALLAILFALHRLRLRRVSAQIRGRLEARLAERERIARELHDTLLQGVQGLILRFQAATDRIPPDEPARNLMETSLDRADKLLAESRDKVKDLRPSTTDVKTLEQALATEGAHFAELHPAECRVSVQGSVRDLHPLVREEGFLIAREALSNAYRHSRALIVEIEVTYGEEALQMRIRDDGEGISSDLLAAGGRPGHFGLIGMRERANKLGAHMQVWSKPGAGTEVELRVPSSVAYVMSDQRGARPRRWAAALRSLLLPRRSDVDRAGTSA